jgi:hypothetical protein
MKIALENSVVSMLIACRGVFTYPPRVEGIEKGKQRLSAVILPGEQKYQQENGENTHVTRSIT